MAEIVILRTFERFMSNAILPRKIMKFIAHSEFLE